MNYRICGANASERKVSVRLAEILAFGLLLIASPIAVIALVLPVNEYSWMGSEGPPDCDMVAGLLLLPVGLLFAGGFFGFGLLWLQRRSALRLLGFVLSAAIVVGICLKLPEYFSESARASTQCSN